jgi:hypothetical protein
MINPMEVFFFFFLSLSLSKQRDFIEFNSKPQNILTMPQKQMVGNNLY